MSLLQSLRPGGKHGLASTETRDPIGYAVAALGKLAQSDVLDRLGLRRQTEQAVFSATRGGFRTVTRASRTFTRAGSRSTPVRGRPTPRAPGSSTSPRPRTSRCSSTSSPSWPPR